MKIRPQQDLQLGCFGRDFAEISAIFSRDPGLGRTLRYDMSILGLNCLHTTRAAKFTCVNGTILCFCNKRLQNWPTVYANFSTLPASWFFNSIS